MGQLTGCRLPPINRLEVVDYRSGGSAQRQYEDFDEAYYRMGAGGHAEVLLRRISTHLQDPTQKITQVVHLRAYWTPVGGRTFADGSMLNAHVRYFIVQGTSAVGYEGGGFLEYHEDPRRGILTAEFNGANLQPLRREGAYLDVFERADLHGRRIRAQRDSRRVSRILNDMERLLGPPPALPPQPSGPLF